MPRYICSAIAAIITSASLLAAPAPVTTLKKGPSAEEIQKAIEELSSPRFVVRERASQFLYSAGAAAEAALREAAKSTDEETASRAKSILEKFDWGLYPDTPPEIVKLIERFRGGDVGVRQQTIGELIRKKPTRFATIRKLIAHEQNDDARAAMYETMSHQVRQAVPSLIVSNSLDEANELLEICIASSNPRSLQDYAAFQHLRNQVPEAIQRMEARRKHGPRSEVLKANEALAYLYRIQKNWPAARKAAENSGNKKLLNDVAWEANDWKALAGSDALTDFREDNRGEEAAYHRLAGNNQKYDELIADMRKELAGVEGDDSTAYTLAVALLLNGQGSEAIAILKDRPKRQPELIFDILCAQLKFREAFDFAGRAIKEIEKEEATAFLRDELDLQRAKVLAGLGDRDAATQIFRGALDRTLAGDRLRIGNQTAAKVVKAVAGIGMRQLAAECAARTLAHHEKNGYAQSEGSILDPIFGEMKLAACVWWHALRHDQPKEEAEKTMAMVVDFAHGKADRKMTDQLVAAIGKLRNRTKTKPNPIEPFSFAISIPQIDYGIAEAYRITGMADKAEPFYQKAAEAKEPRSDFDVPWNLEDALYADEISLIPTQYRFVMVYADFLLSQKRYKEAAAQYRKAWNLAPAQPTALFMTGFALSKSGNEVEGSRLMSLAHWVPLGDDGVRTNFGDQLSSRGFDADSRKEMELILATTWFRTHYFGNALLRMARIKARQKDYATAALYYEKDVVSLFRTGAYFIEPRAYLTVPELARTYRARALFAAGKIDDAMAEIRAGLAVLPGNVDVAIGFVPDLDRAGRKKDADEIYGKVKAAFESALQDYGSSPDLRNSLAWTMVVCNRDLDDALKHSQKAVEGAPKIAGYIDTLAEIHFRKKDRAKALELMKQCAALEPANPYFRKQLERFEKKPFDSPLPDEETGDDD